MYVRDNMSASERPIIVQRDGTVLVEIESPAYPEVRDLSENQFFRGHGSLFEIMRNITSKSRLRQLARHRGDGGRLG